MAYIKPTDRNKPWAIKKMTDKRVLRDFNIRNLFRIYCEGENTEPEYIKSFPVNTETKIEAIGLGRSKTALVEKAIELFTQDKLLPGQDNFDEDRQLWVVFDYDVRGIDREAQDYNYAIELAGQHGMRVAYSNDSFELWFVLHFQYHEAAVTRNEYYQILSEKLNCNYEEEGKTRDFTQSLYHILVSRQAVAMQNAMRLFEQKAELMYSDQNPCTTVFKLVQELNKCLKS
jgi:hypothetical protein